MQKRRSLSFLLPVCCLLFLLTSCVPVQGPPAPTATHAPSFKGASPLIIRPPLFQVNNVAWSPDGKRIAIANGDGVFQVWEAVTSKTIYTYHGHHDAVLAVAWSPDGRRVASSGQDGTIQIW